ncbi:GTP-binding protein [Agrilactobacillus composti DSM 18527 = JCM 14202]|uniref:GTP-binding protein n=1 Tax=Agrilactobacillus composti DSM 18527 = JCM 14202 TaxID=1423734 RepID=X0PPQ1_9LACO|nr:ribosome biogenesis GTPase YqeH [Agrilactobacillus composti]KRM35788.1 GTP-binding protein [Agrilactobacillus composti DSM 18527 = JCM 14202]GAF39652.1 GTP-binding protein YqeH [Agrilactobacillus composti DSM 18527 = JCM 14202]
MEKQEALYCIGCGSRIQTEDKTAPGFIPKSALAKQLTDENADIYCQRCFRLRHYNEITPVSIANDEFVSLLNEIGNHDALIINVIDIFDFNGSIIPGLHRFVGHNPVIVVGNKEDVLPRDVSRGKVRQWLFDQSHAQGLRPDETLLVSSRTGHNVDKLMALIDQYRLGRDVYVVGTTNVGKSTLINQIIQENMAIKDLITTSRFPGTTLDRIEIPFGDGHTLIDTPGIIHEHQIAHLLSPKDLNLIAPQKPLKPKTYQLNDNQTIFLGGLGRFDYIRGDRQGIIVYADDQLMLHRTKLENADAFYAKHVGELLVPPRAKDLADFPKLVRHEFSINTKTDIVFGGLGWITVAKAGIVAAYAPENVDVVVRKAII